MAAENELRTLDLTIKTEVEDYRKLNFIYFKNSLIAISVFYFALILIINLVFNITRKANIQNIIFNLSFSIPLTLAIVAAFTLFMFLMIKVKSKKIFEADEVMQQEQNVLVNGEGFSEETKFGKTSFKWHRVYKILETKTTIYIFMSKGKALIIPKKFMDDSQIRLFKQIVNSKVDAKKIKWAKKQKNIVTDLG